MSDEDDYNSDEDYEYEYTDDEEDAGGADADAVMEDSLPSQDEIDSGNPNNGDRVTATNKSPNNAVGSKGGMKRRSSGGGRMGDNPNAPPMLGKFDVFDNGGEFFFRSFRSSHRQPQLNDRMSFYGLNASVWI